MGPSPAAWPACRSSTFYRASCVSISQGSTAIRRPPMARGAEGRWWPGQARPGSPDLQLQDLWIQNQGALRVDSRGGSLSQWESAWRGPWAADTVSGALSSSDEQDTESPGQPPPCSSERGPCNLRSRLGKGAQSLQSPPPT